MSFRTLKASSVVGAALLLVVGLLLTPSLAVAQQGIANGALLEVKEKVKQQVTESPPAEAAAGEPDMPSTFPPGISKRLAKASEVGWLVGTGSLTFLTGQVVLQAQSQVPFDPADGGWGVGSILGHFHIDTADGAVKGAIDGNLDFTLFNPTAEHPLGVPLAPTSGGWRTLGKNRTGGLFKGVALVPFFCGQERGFCYLELGPDGQLTGGFTPLADTEYNEDGEPLAKFMFTLFQ